LEYLQTIFLNEIKRTPDLESVMVVVTGGSLLDSAVVLNLEHTWKRFGKNWREHPDWIEEAEENVMDLWKSMLDCETPSQALCPGRSICAHSGQTSKANIHH
jgi:hypothetical protein